MIIIKNGEVSVASVAQQSKWEEILEVIPDAIKKITKAVSEDENEALESNHESK